jgi:hypothetical protein
VWKENNLEELERYQLENRYSKGKNHNLKSASYLWEHDLLHASAAVSA